MKTATNDQIREIRLIATEKLAALKDRSDPAEFERLLAIAMQGIAHDIGLEIGGAVYDVAGPQSLDLFETHGPALIPANLYISCRFEEVRDWIAKLCDEGRVATLSVLEHSEAVDSFAASCDEVPVFLVGTRQEAIDLAHRFSATPYLVIQNALNYDQVGSRYLEGRPT